MSENIKEKAADACLVLKSSLKSFKKNDDFEKSAALAYYGFFALIPLLLLVYYVLRYFILSSGSAITVVEDLASQTIPEFGKVLKEEVHSVSRDSRIWQGLGIFTLFWSITPLVDSFRVAFIRTFNADDDTPFIKTVLIKAVVALSLLVLLVALAINQLFHSAVIRQYAYAQHIFVALNAGLSMLLSVAVITAFYRALLPVKVKLPHLLAGGVSTAVLLAVMGPVFTAFLKYNPDYGVAFGSLKALFIFFVWVYYSFAVVLFGGEIIANARKKDALLLKCLFSNVPISSKAKGRNVRRFLRECCEGEILFKQGDTGDEMFYVFSGSVTLTTNDTVVKVVKEGEYFGEMSMLLDSPRTATAVISAPGTQLAVICHGTFETLLNEEPKIILGVLKEMALRLKTTNQCL